MTIPTFTGADGESVVNWISDVDNHFQSKEVPDNERLPFAFQHLSGPVISCVMSLDGHLKDITGKSWEWSWRRLKVALTEIEKQIKNNGRSMEDKVATAVKVIVFTGAACIAGPALLTAGLGAIGFSAVGPVAGTIAAGIQSSVYGGAVGAGSLFAFCQSLTMGGAGAAVLASGISGVGGAAAAAIMEKSPSKSWEDGEHFWPSIKVIEELKRLFDSEEK